LSALQAGGDIGEASGLGDILPFSDGQRESPVKDITSTESVHGHHVQPGDVVYVFIFL
jgi:hypothetical protein